MDKSISTLREYYISNLTKAQIGENLSFEICYYMTSHATLIIGIELESRIGKYLEFSGVSFARFVPRWKSDKIKFLSPIETVAYLEKLGVDSHYICCTDEQEPSFLVAFSILGVSNELPEIVRGLYPVDNP